MQGDHHLMFILSITGAVFNALLIVVAVIKAPKFHKISIIIVIKKAVVDILILFTSLLLTGKIVSIGNDVLIISDGYCTTESKCFSVLLILTSFMQFNLIWLILSYLLRHYTLFYRNLTGPAYALIMIFCYAPCLLHSFAWISTYSYGAVMRTSRVFSRPESIVLSRWVVQQSTLATMLELLAMSIGVLIFFVKVRCGLVAFLNKNRSRLSRNAIVYNEKFFKFIHFQTLIPIVYIIAVIIFFLMHFSILGPINIQYIVSFLFISTSFVSPISYALFLRPHGNFCFGVQRQNNQKKGFNLRMSTVHTKTIASVM